MFFLSTASWISHQTFPSGTGGPLPCPVRSTLSRLCSWPQEMLPCPPAPQSGSCPLSPSSPIFWGEHTPSPLQAASCCHGLLQYSPDRSPFPLSVCSLLPSSRSSVHLYKLATPSTLSCPTEWSSPSSRIASHLLCAFAKAARTENLKPGGSNNRAVFFHSSGCWKS